MNIFRVHDDPTVCAEWHTNRHTLKMILEYGQLLSTAHHVVGSDLDPLSIYKRTHQNHPSAVWVRESKSNYRWLHSLLTALCKEYTYRYGKVHKVGREDLLNRLSLVPPSLPDILETKLCLAMPDEYRRDSVTESYQRFYVFGKSHLHQWRNRPVPPFVETLNSERTITTTSSTKEIIMTASMLVPGSVWERQGKKSASYSTVIAVSNDGLPQETLDKFPQQVVFLTDKWKVLTQPVDVFLKSRTFFTMDSEAEALINQLTTEPQEVADDESIDIDSVEVDNSVIAGMVGPDDEGTEEDVSQVGDEEDSANPVMSSLFVGEHLNASSLERAFCGYSESAFFTGDTLLTLRFTLSTSLSLDNIKAAFWLRDPSAIQEIVVSSAYENTTVKIDSFVGAYLEVVGNETFGILQITSAGDFRGEAEEIVIEDATEVDFTSTETEATTQSTTLPVANVQHIQVV